MYPCALLLLRPFLTDYLCPWSPVVQMCSHVSNTWFSLEQFALKTNVPLVSFLPRSTSKHKVSLNYSFKGSKLLMYWPDVCVCLGENAFGWKQVNHLLIFEKEAMFENELLVSFEAEGQIDGAVLFVLRKAQTSLGRVAFWTIWSLYSPSPSKEKKTSFSNFTADTNHVKPCRCQTRASWLRY